MAKAIESKKQLNKINLQNLSERDRDFLTLEVPAVMEKYKVGKQSVYDRRFALNKKLRAAGLSIEDVTKNVTPKVSTSPEEPTSDPVPVKKATAKSKTADKLEQDKPTAQEPEKILEGKSKENEQESLVDLTTKEKSSAVFVKPIEINFGSFSIKLNGVPGKIAVNPETNAIEITL